MTNDSNVLGLQRSRLYPTMDDADGDAKKIVGFPTIHSANIAARRRRRLIHYLRASCLYYVYVRLRL